MSTLGRPRFNTDELFQNAMIAIIEHGLIFKADISAYLGISTSTFYEHFPQFSQHLKQMDQALLKNKIDLKIGLRKKWRETDNPTLQLALYKLVCTNEERQALQMNQAFPEQEKSLPRPLVLDADMLKELLSDNSIED
jgi:hypothetical protein